MFFLKYIALEIKCLSTVGTKMRKKVAEVNALLSLLFSFFFFICFVSVWVFWLHTFLVESVRVRVSVCVCLCFLSLVSYVKKWRPILLLCLSLPLCLYLTHTHTRCMAWILAPCIFTHSAYECDPCITFFRISFITFSLSLFLSLSFLV